jgi:hypothetical protein
VPWAKAVLRGQRVLARVKEDGTFAAEGGRVEIRYKPNDGRAYQAGARNLELVAGEPLLPDDACVPGEKVASKEERKAERGRTHESRLYRLGRCRSHVVDLRCCPHHRGNRSRSARCYEISRQVRVMPWPASQRSRS